MPYLMFGYAVQDEWLFQYAKHRGYVPCDDSSWSRSEAIFAGVSVLMADSGVYAKLGTVLMKGEYRSFIALATNDPGDGLMTVPPSEDWADLKTILGRKQDPTWQRYV